MSDEPILIRNGRGIIHADYARRILAAASERYHDADHEYGPTIDYADPTGDVAIWNILITQALKEQDNLS